ncbi:DNA replication/repair protein RecF [Marilutibacter aestuarii]|uniref:DNA replication and repair protein RecF n=1 Tax=Marilutibacter aestuarii TaxID=1706195 RepID=A0A508A271_9GAMM|nr:DNA replication/repair protein RecF [Lysobacter aestuarii]TQD39922.1 DNA replication/repair protein RecF [Lysobacter aestuarii]
MQITRLDLRRFRRFDEATLAPFAGLNLVTGDNGAGKTSLLEAMHLMAYGRSFRGRVRDGLLKDGAADLEVFVEWREHRVPGDSSSVRVRRAGLRHSGQDWTGRLDGENVAQLGDLCAALAVVSFEPGSHALVTGSAENRRRYLDWGLFHVEQEFMPLWRRYARALKQRNALLKSGRVRDGLEAWERELAEAGESLSRRRQLYLESLHDTMAPLLDRLAPGLGRVDLEYLPGWRRDAMPLADALLLARERDLQAGYTSVGPHRADWRIRFPGLPGREALSRGQAKLTALAAILGQAAHHAHARGAWPVIALDDLGSELDRTHQGRVLEWLMQTDAQVFITGTEAPAALARAHVAVSRFHVEHGGVHEGVAGPPT